MGSRISILTGRDCGHSL